MQELEPKVQWGGIIAVLCLGVYTVFNLILYACKLNNFEFNSDFKFDWISLKFQEANFLHKIRSYIVTDVFPRKVHHLHMAMSSSS